MRNGGLGLNDERCFCRQSTGPRRTSFRQISVEFCQVGATFAGVIVSIAPFGVTSWLVLNVACRAARNVSRRVLQGLSSVFFNKGENCIAAGRLFVEESIHDEYVQRVVSATHGTQDLRVQLPLNVSPCFSSSRQVGLFDARVSSQVPFHFKVWQFNVVSSPAFSCGLL